VLPIPASEPSEVYTFTEDFKLAGQQYNHNSHQPIKKRPHLHMYTPFPS
jgi:hypothetical protein